VPSKKQSDTSQEKKRHKPRYFVDRNLGSIILPKLLRDAGLTIVVHDDVYQQDERDPWIFYECGKKKLVVVTSDTLFMKSFPHMAAIAVARTSVIGFTNNNYKAEVRACAFVKARGRIEKALTAHRGRYFIGIVGTGGEFRIRAESPIPSRKTCDAKDWASYERVCTQEGLLALAPRH
jgi:predicted nuclease of predicted toxin-antitoxin system